MYFELEYRLECCEKYSWSIDGQMGRQLPAAKRLANQVDGLDLRVVAEQVLRKMFEQYRAHAFRACAGLSEITHSILSERAHKAQRSHGGTGERRAGIQACSGKLPG